MKRLIVSVAILSLLAVGCAKKEEAKAAPAPVKTEQAEANAEHKECDKKAEAKCDKDVAAVCDSLKAAGKECDTAKCDSLKKACEKTVKAECGSEKAAEATVVAEAEVKEEKHSSDCKH